MSLHFALRPLRPWATLAIFTGLFSVCVWLIRSEHESLYSNALAWIIAITSVGCSVAFTVSLSLRQFPRLAQVGFHRTGVFLTLVSFLMLPVIFFGIWHIAREDISDIIYISIVVGAVLGILAAVAFKGWTRAAQGKFTMKGVRVCIGCGLATIPIATIPIGALLLPLGFLAVVYGIGGYFALSMRPLSNDGGPCIAPNGGLATPVGNSGASDGPPSVS